MQNPLYVFSISKVMTICINTLAGISIKSLLLQPMHRSLILNQVFHKYNLDTKLFTQATNWIHALPEIEILRLNFLETDLFENLGFCTIFVFHKIQQKIAINYKLVIAADRRRSTVNEFYETQNSHGSSQHKSKYNFSCYISLIFKYLAA